VYGTALAWLDQSLLRVVAARLRTLDRRGAAMILRGEAA
jgi:hypothetical protein